jgi:hypothetical protein
MGLGEGWWLSQKSLGYILNPDLEEKLQFDCLEDLCISELCESTLGFSRKFLQKLRNDT